MFCPHSRTELRAEIVEAGATEALSSWQSTRSYLSQNSAPETLKSDSTYQLAYSLCDTCRWPASLPLPALSVHHVRPTCRFDPKLHAGALCRRLHHLRQLMIRRDSSGTSSQRLRTSIEWSKF